MADPLDFGSLGIKTGSLPPEFSQALMGNLDELLQQQERKQVGRVLGEQEERGILRSGLTRQELERQVLEPGIASRRGALLDLLRQGLGEGREERMAETGFQRERTLRSEAFNMRLQEMGQMLANQRNLLQFQADLEGQDEGFGWGEFAGGILGTIAGSAAGGFGGAVGGKAGGMLAGKLFGGGSKKS